MSGRLEGGAAPKPRMPKRTTPTLLPPTKRTQPDGEEAKTENKEIADMTTAVPSVAEEEEVEKENDEGDVEETKQEATEEEEEKSDGEGLSGYDPKMAAGFGKIHWRKWENTLKSMPKNACDWRNSNLKTQERSSQL